MTTKLGWNFATTAALGLVCMLASTSCLPGGGGRRTECHDKHSSSSLVSGGSPPAAALAVDALGDWAAALAGSLEGAGGHPRNGDLDPLLLEPRVLLVADLDGDGLDDHALALPGAIVVVQLSRLPREPLAVQLDFEPLELEATILSDPDDPERVVGFGLPGAGPSLFALWLHRPEAPGLGGGSLGAHIALGEGYER